MTDQTPAVANYDGPRRILSGIQASGALHLGNYLGALKRFVELQDQGAPVFDYLFEGFHPLNFTFVIMQI